MKPPIYLLCAEFFLSLRLKQRLQLGQLQT